MVIWKFAIGCLLLFGGLKEAIKVWTDYKIGASNDSPVAALLGCFTLAALGGYIMKKSKKKSL